MSDPRVPILPERKGERLARDDYRKEFRARDAAVHGKNSWKLERLQHFEEIGNASRDAFRDGDIHEHQAHLPELVVLGGSVLYQVLYTDNGRPNGAVRYDDPVVVESWEYFISRLYESGEDVRAFFQRQSVDLSVSLSGVDDYRN